MDIQEYWQPIVEQMSIVDKVEDDAIIYKYLEQLDEMYAQIQQTPCPHIADDIYTDVVRAIMNLRQTFEAVTQLNYPEAEYTYEQLQLAYNNIHAGLENLGICGY